MLAQIGPEKSQIVLPPLYRQHSALDSWAATESSWWWVSDPYAPPLFDLYHSRRLVRWLRFIDWFVLWVCFCKLANDYRALLQEITCKDKASYGSAPPCTHHRALSRRGNANYRVLLRKRSIWGTCNLGCTYALDLQAKRYLSFGV